MASKHDCFRQIVELLIRSHEAKDNGYEIHHGGKCVTVFSAPNYWYDSSAVL